MQCYIGPILMISIASLLSLIIYALLNRNSKNNIIHIYMAFWYFYLFIISAMKWRLGHARESIFDSFYDIQNSTYIHYGVPLVLLAIIVPVILKLLLGKSEIKLIKIFDSSICFVLILSFFCVIKLNNKVYCITFILAMVISAITFLLKRNSEPTFVLEEYKNGLTKITPVILLWVITIIIYTPCELYLGNANDFPISFWYFFWKMLTYGVIIFTVSIVSCMIFLTGEHFELLYTVLFALLVMGYIQGMFLNGAMSPLDGNIQTWSNTLKIVNLAIWITAITIWGILKSHKRELTERIIKLVSIWITLIQIVSLGVLIITSDDTEDKSISTLTIDGMLEIGNENNILVFVLDKFDGRIMDEILEEKPDFLEPLNDFTYYTNATSEFWPTVCSIPFLLTGTEFDDDNMDYTSYAFNDDDILIKKLYEKGYDLGVYTNDNLLSDSVSGIISNYADDVKRTCGMTALAQLMMQASKYKMSPFVCKNYFIYDTSDIEELVEDDRVYHTNDDLPFYKRLISQELYVSDKDNVFRFIHMKGAHAQYTMSEDFQHIEYDPRRDIDNGTELSQATGSVKIVFEYIKQLKELGKYDDATIIITADHGSRITSNLSYPILFVKESGENSNQIKESVAPVCQADLIPTIEKAAGVEYSEPTIEEYAENDTRTRTFRIKDGNTYIKYEIDGDVKNEGNWKMIYSNE